MSTAVELVETTSEREARLDPPPSAAAPPIGMARIGRNTAIYAAGVLINRAASFLMLPIYSRRLSPADYGVIGLVELTLDFIAILAGAKLAVGVFRYYHAAKTDAERNAVTSTSLLLICALYAAVSIGVCVAAPLLSDLVFRDPSRATLIRVSAVGLLGQSLFLIPLAHTRAEGRASMFVVANTTLLALQIMLNLLFLVVLRLGPLGVFLSGTIAAWAVGGVLAARLVRRVGLHFSTAAARRLVRYGVPLIATQVATFIATFGDRYFLTRVADMTSVGLYTLAYQFGFLLALVGSTPVDLVWEPIRFSLAERTDRDFVLSRAFVYLNLLLITVALGITLFVDGVLRIMTQPAFYPAAGLVPVILVAYVFQSWSGMHDLGIHLRERTEYLTLANWVGAVVALAGYALLIPRWYGLGAAISTAIAFGIRYLVTRHYSLRLFPVRYDWRPVGKIVAFAVAAAVIGLVSPHRTLTGMFVFRAALLALYGVAVWHSGVLSERERTVARRFVGALIAGRLRAATTS